MVDHISDPYPWVSKWVEYGGSVCAEYACRGNQKASILMRVVISSLSESTKEQLVRKLLDYGAYSYGIGAEGGGWKMRSDDVSGWNALLSAVERQYKEIARMLLDKGAAYQYGKVSDGNGGTNDIDAWDVLDSINVSNRMEWLSMITSYSPIKELYEAKYGKRK
jgi:hypothetical protein